MFKYMEKYKEAEEYYQILPSGYIKNKEPAGLSSKGKNTNLAKSRKKKAQALKNGDNNKSMMGSMAHTPAIRGKVTRANRSSSDFMKVFGALDRAAPESTVETGATMKQILKMMNSRECKEVIASDSYLMTHLLQQPKFNQQIDYLYLSLFTRKATPNEHKIAQNFLGPEAKFHNWAKYTLALLNSPEFYFIK